MGNTIELLEHNQKIYNQVIEYIKQDIKRIGIVQDTGLGKTYIGAKLIFEFFKGLRVLYIAPTNQLINFVNMKHELEYVDYVETSTYVSLKKNNEKYDVIILDEFHRAGAPTWEPAVNDKINSGAIIIGLSATPIRYCDGKDMRYLFEKIIEGISIEEAMERDLIPPIESYISTYFNIYNEETMQLIKRMKDTPEGRLLYEWTDVNNILTKRCPDYKDRKWIVFFSSIADLENSDKFICKWLGIKKTQIVRAHSKRSPKLNNRALKMFSENDNIRVIKSCNMLNEGVHVDDATGIIMLRWTMSPIIYKQQMGRIIRIGTKKAPVVVDLVANHMNLKEKLNGKYGFFRNKIDDDCLITIRKFIRKVSENVFDYTVDIDKLFMDIKKSGEKHEPLSDEEKKIIDDNIHLSAPEIVEILKDNGYERSMSAIRYYKRKNGYKAKRYFSDEEKKIIDDNIHLSAPEIVEILKDNGYERGVPIIYEYKRKNGYGTGKICRRLSIKEKKIINDNIHLSARKMAELLKEHGYERNIATIRRLKREKGYKAKRYFSDEEKKIIEDNIHLSAPKIVEILKENGYERSAGSINNYKCKNGYGTGKRRLSIKEKKIIEDNIHLSAPKIVEILKENGYERSSDIVNNYKRKNGYGSGITYLSDEEKKIIDDNIHLSGPKIVEILKENGYERSISCICNYKNKNNNVIF